MTTGSTPGAGPRVSAYAPGVDPAAWVMGPLMALFALVGLFMAARAEDIEMTIFGYSLLGFGLAFNFGLIKTHFDMRDGAVAPLGGAYNEEVVRRFVLATVFWGSVGMLVGVYLAAELAWPSLNLGLSFINFGRLRPVHTSAVIFAFGGNALFGTSLYVVQRTCRASLFGGRPLANFLFWGYNFLIVQAALAYVLGFSRGQEYSELEWHLGLWLTIVWVAYLICFVGTLIKRQEPHIYVANWFYLAFIITVAMLHVVNSLAIPVGFGVAKGYTVYSGVQNALIQWWYGHNAVGFFLTAGFLGMMYYFIPKAANRPVYSYRLSIVHFWSLIFMYIWAGPHHLHYTALPDWAQMLGMAFSIMLWMPSWGGMINGLMTLSGAWDKLRTDPGLRFSVTAVGFYGMSTFEGPVMSVRTVNALSHYTDWGIGHVHSGSLGWVGFITFGALYYLIPVLWQRERMYSTALIAWHYWVATLGIVFYISSMWVAGIMQGLMWRAYDSHGFLQYSFLESVVAMHPLYIIRWMGGLMYLSGMLIMVFNVAMTVSGRAPAIGGRRDGVPNLQPVAAE